MAATREKLRWLVIVKQGRAHDIFLHSLGFKTSRYDARDYVAFVSVNRHDRLLKKLIGRLAERGISPTITRQISFKKPDPPDDHVKRKPRSPPATSSEIIALQLARENRLKAEATARARENRRQKERLATRDADQRAREAVRRAKGEN